MGGYRLKMNFMLEHPLEERCLQFALKVRNFCRQLKFDVCNHEDIKQVARSSGSVGANYIEANENLGAADLRYRIRISRKEAKESVYFLHLLEVFGDEELEKERKELVEEAQQLRKIFSAILLKLN
jgi:four helix bundle protein